MGYIEVMLIFTIMIIAAFFILNIMDRVLSFFIDVRLKKSANFAISMDVPNKFAYESILDFVSLKSSVRDLKNTYSDISNAKDYEKYGFAIILLYSELKERERLHALIVKISKIITPQLRETVRDGRAVTVTEEVFAYVFMLACNIERASISLESVVYIIDKIFYDDVGYDNLVKLHDSVLESEDFYEICRRLYLTTSIEVMDRKGNYLKDFLRV